MKRNVTHEPTLWESLPAEQRQAIERELKAKSKQPIGKEQPKKNGQFQLKGYVRCELSQSDKEAFREWEQSYTPVQAFERLVKAADSGYLLKVGQTGTGAQASLCAAWTEQPWDGFVLVAHAGNASRAAMLLVFKHEVIMQSSWDGWLSEEGEDALR